MYEFEEWEVPTYEVEEYEIIICIPAPILQAQAIARTRPIPALPSPRCEEKPGATREKAGESKKGHSSTLVLALSGVFLVLLASSVLSSTLKGSTSRRSTSTRSSAVSNQVYTIDDPAYRVTGSPSISADFIDKVLSAYGSPAAGTGGDLYNLGIQFGIDPVFALAFFMHEDSFGKAGIGAANHSLGNIRCSAGYSCQYGFRSYASWADAYQDWYSLISDGYVHGSIAGHPCATVDEIVPVYAPAADHNNESAYEAAVKHAVDTWRSGKVRV